MLQFKFRNQSGSAIVLVLAFGTVVTLLAFTWILYSVSRSSTPIQKREQVTAMYAAESVISQVIYELKINPNALKLKKLDSNSIVQTIGLATKQTSMYDTNFTSYTDSIHKSKATATVEEQNSYLLVNAVGEAGGATCAITAKFGYAIPREFSYALIEGSNNDPLDVGRGQIIGNVSVGRQPLGNINGNVEINGVLPQIDKDAIDKPLSALEDTMKGTSVSQLINTTEFVTTVIGDKTYSSFKPPPISSKKQLFITGNMLIENRGSKPLVLNGPATIVVCGAVQISGNVELNNVTVCAVNAIKCFDDCRLTNATLYSKKFIALDNRVVASGNFYAKESVILFGKSKIEMPAFVSVTGVPDSISNNPKRGLILLQQSSMTGVAYCKEGSTRSQIERQAVFTGFIYTNGKLELEGKVNGTVVCGGLIERMGDVEKHTLAGGTINQKLLPKGFILPQAFGKQSADFKVVSWEVANSYNKGVKSEK